MVSSSHPYFSVLCLKSGREIACSNLSEKVKCKMSDRMSPPSQLIDLSFKTTALAQSQQLGLPKLVKIENPQYQQLRQQQQQLQQQQQQQEQQHLPIKIVIPCRPSLAHPRVKTENEQIQSCSENLSSPKRNENLSFGMDRLLGKSSNENSETKPIETSLSPRHLEFTPTSLSLATSLTPTSFVPAMVSSLRPLSMYANHGSPLLHHPSLAFRHLQSPLMSHPPSPSQSYLQGLYSQSIFLGLRPSDLYQGPPGMNFHSSLHAHHLGAVLGTGKRKKSWTRAVFSHLQRKGLEKRFQIQKYITKPDRRQLAASLGLTDAQVKVWFQNRRMKWRHQENKQRREQERAAATAASGGANSSKPEQSSTTSSIQPPNSSSLPTLHLPSEYHRFVSRPGFESPSDSPMSGESGSEYGDVIHEGSGPDSDLDNDQQLEIKVD